MSKEVEDLKAALQQVAGQRDMLQAQLAQAENVMAGRAVGFVSQMMDGLAFLCDAAESGEPEAKKALARFHNIVQASSRLSSAIIVPK